MTRHHDGCHLCRHGDFIYESCEFGAHPYGGGLPHGHLGGCHGAGVQRLRADAAISTQCHWK